jgi:hypothetical protein
MPIPNTHGQYYLNSLKGTNLPSPPERSRRGTTHFSGPPLHTSKHATLTTYLVLIHGVQPHYSLLHSLCTDLRSPSDQRRMPGIINDDG